MALQLCSKSQATPKPPTLEGQRRGAACREQCLRDKAPLSERSGFPSSERTGCCGILSPGVALARSLDNLMPLACECPMESAPLWAFQGEPGLEPGLGHLPQDSVHSSCSVLAMWSEGMASHSSGEAGSLPELGKVPQTWSSQWDA